MKKKPKTKETKDYQKGFNDGYRVGVDMVEESFSEQEYWANHERNNPNGLGSWNH